MAPPYFTGDGHILFLGTEKLRLGSEATLRRPMITHTIDQFLLNPKRKQDKVKVTNFKNLPKRHFFILK